MLELPGVPTYEMYAAFNYEMLKLPVRKMMDDGEPYEAFKCAYAAMVDMFKSGVKFEETQK